VHATRAEAMVRERRIVAAALEGGADLWHDITAQIPL
jgi:hypothetical protein